MTTGFQASDGSLSTSGDTAAGYPRHQGFAGHVETGALSATG
jgi:hypothetical protein